MKRYTLKVQCLEHSMSLAGFRQALDDLLLHTQPPLIYRLGKVQATDSGGLVAEIASDAKKDFLEARLKTLESELPIRVEGLGWGWITESVSNPQVEEAATTFKVGKTFDLVRYFFLLFIPLALIIWALLWYRAGQDGRYQFVILLIYIVWLSLWNDTPVNFRLHTKQVDCLAGELVVTYWFRREAIRLKWQDLWGLEMKGRTCVLTTNGKPVRFYIPYRVKTKELDSLIQTIAQRASLNNVDAGIGRMLLKRYEAP